MLKTIWAAAALSLVAIPALAHITLETKEAPVGASYKAVFRVTHGCEGAPTIGLRVKIPEGLIGVKPMPKPGWRTLTTKGAYERAYAFYHGKTLSEGVREVSWVGDELPDEFVDEFTLFGFVANELEAGKTLTFPVIQDCAGGKSTEWVETVEGAKSPAPVLKLTAGEHAGHH